MTYEAAASVGIHTRLKLRRKIMDKGNGLTGGENEDRGVNFYSLLVVL